MKKIIIAGAGITGLSVGYHLRGLDFEVIEKENEPGGLARSKKIGDFYLDYGGHFIHGKDSYFLETLQSLFGGSLKKWERKAYILKDEKLIPYPFQANLSLLPYNEKFECVRDFIENSFKGKKKASNFKDWLKINFGEGMCKSFFFHYNSKFWIYPLESLSYEWCSWGIPVPHWMDVLKSALGEIIKGLGYNPFIYYPYGGIVQFPLKLMESFREKVILGREIKRIDLKKRVLIFQNGESMDFEILISTIPLVEMIKVMENPPPSILQYSSGLRFISTIVVNAIIKGKDFESIDWIYLPEKWTPFYRIGFYPEGKDSRIPLFSEISILPDSEIEEGKIYLELFNLLRKLKLIEKKENIEYFETIKIPYAYVVFDNWRRRNLPKILSFLKKNRIISTGRYGSWDYLSMERSFLLGKEVAERIVKEL